MTDNDGVKVVGWGCKMYSPNRVEYIVDKKPCDWHGDKDALHYDHPLISALDEADAVDKLCNQCVGGDRKINYPSPTSPCKWNGHAHADKLRGLKNG